MKSGKHKICCVCVFSCKDMRFVFYSTVSKNNKHLVIQTISHQFCYTYIDDNDSSSDFKFDDDFLFLRLKHVFVTHCVFNFFFFRATFLYSNNIE